MTPTAPFLRRALLAQAVALCAAPLGLNLVHAQAQAAYPDKPVRIVVGFAPGGTNDILARAIAVKLTERLGQTFVVDNKPGANSALGNDLVAKARPDGHTLLVSSSGGLTVNPVLMPKLAYDPVRDFEPIALLATFPLIVAVNNSLPVASFADLVRHAGKTTSGSLDHGVASSSFQLVAELLGNTSGMKLNHINYRGSGPTVIALLGGEIQVAVLDSAAVMTQVKAGKLKALAVTTAQRSSALPDLPTVAEAGFAGYDVPIWTALMAPKGTPEPVLAKLRGAVREILADKEIIARLQALGMEPGNTDGAALSRRIGADIARWTAVAKTTNIVTE